MSVDRMRKLSLIVYNPDRDCLLRDFQGLGFIHLEAAAGEKGGATPAAAGQGRAEIERRLSDLDSILRFLDGNAPAGKKGLLRSLAEYPPAVPYGRLRETARAEDIGAVTGRMIELEKGHKEGLQRLDVLKKEKERVMLWKDCGLDLGILNGASEFFDGHAGAVSSGEAAGFLEGLRERTPYADGVLAFESGQEAYFYIVCLRQDRKAVQDYLRDRGFLDIAVSGRSGGVSGVLSDIEKDIRLAEKENRGLAKAVKKALESRSKLRMIYDYLLIKKERFEAAAKGAEAGSVSVFNGWFPASREKDLLRYLSTLDGADYQIGDPAKDDDVPVNLRVGLVPSPFEPITRMYGIPKYGASLDPTPHITPFYFVFFGICLSDFVYGAILFVVFGFLAIVSRRNRPVFGFMKFLAVVGVSTMIFGAALGSFLGDFFTNPRYCVIAPLKLFLNGLTIVNPMEKPLLILYLSLALGAVQLLYGLVLKMATRLKDGVADALFETLPWIVLLSGFFGIFLFAGFPTLQPGLPALAPFLFNSLQIMMGAGALFVVINGIRKEKNKIAGFFGGLYSLYGLTSFMGDLLSYARLLALGVGTGVIAMVMNFIGFMLIGKGPGLNPVSWLSFLGGITVLVVGHAFNLIMSAFGAFIHSARLQYVEFFSKFYTSGHNEYKPFRKEGVYHNVIEE